MSIELDTEEEIIEPNVYSDIEEISNPFSEANREPDVPTSDYTESLEDDNEELSEGIEEKKDNKDVPRETLDTEWKFPDYLPEEFKPKEFKDTKDELDWFKLNYRKAIDYHSSEEHIKTLAEKYQNYLIEKEDKVEELKAVQKMLEDDPSVAFKLYAPQVLVQLGAQHKLNDSEIYNLVRKQMIQDFGEDYDKVYSPTDADNPNTVSGRMIKRQSELKANLEKLNTEIDEKVANYKIPNEEDRQVLIDNEYNEVFKEDFTREEFDSFRKKADEFIRSGQLSYKHLHTLLELNDYLEDAYEKGVAFGKKSLTKDLENAGGEKINHSPSSTKNGKPIIRDIYDERHPHGTKKFFNPYM